MSQLWQTCFFTTVNHINDLPVTYAPEIAFVGRSNAGKSTAINVLCNQKKLVFTSKTPGCTRHINYFFVPNNNKIPTFKNSAVIKKNNIIQALLVDLPGYGYTQTSMFTRLHLEKLINHYISYRKQLTALVIIMDIRRSITDSDLKIINLFGMTGKPLHCILSKVDKVSHKYALHVLDQTYKQLRHYIQQHSMSFQLTIQLFSSIKRIGIQTANDQVLSLINLSKSKIDI